MSSNHGNKICACGGPMHHSARRCGICRIAHDKGTDMVSRPSKPQLTPAEQVVSDREKRTEATELTTVKAKYQEALKTIDVLEKQVFVINELASREHQPVEIVPQFGHGTSEGTVVIVASDWHAEERVGPEVGYKANGQPLNVFNLEIFGARAPKFFKSAQRLLRLLQQDIRIDHVVLALLGDFISNDIHEEFPEVNQLPPMQAVALVQDHLISGINFLLEHTQVKLTVVCHSGNHARTTRTTRFGTENGHSLEYLMYLHLAAYFRNEPRITFVIPSGMHSYITVYDQTIRFQHGHAIKYGGGVGGIYIPVNKAIAQWDKARHADLNVFGHFHQLRDGGNFVCNGSLIGYNAFALSIKADHEEPKQAMFLMDKKRGRTCTWPILVGDGATPGI